MNDVGFLVMTVQDVAEALKVSEDTILRAANTLFPGLVQNGIPTLLTEAHVTAIKLKIQRHHNLRSTAELPKTALEKQLLIRQAMILQDEMIVELQLRLQEAAPKIESFNALMRSDETMSITDAAKHFGLHPKAEVFPYLRARGYLTGHDLPTQDAIDAGYLSLREVRCPDDTVRKQAVVEARQLETWRKRVVPQIKGWEASA